MLNKPQRTISPYFSKLEIQGGSGVGVVTNCELNGITINHNESQTFYQTETVEYGNTCQSEERTCLNGILSGSYTFTTCLVLEKQGGGSSGVKNGNEEDDSDHGENVCKDSTALNFSATGQHQQSLCIYGEDGEKETKEELWQKILEFFQQKQEQEKSEEEPEPEEQKEFQLTSTCLHLQSEEKIFRKGDNNEEIKKLQSFLKKKKYLSGLVDGDFGKQTKNALQQFQKDNNIKPSSGIFGNITTSFIDRNCHNIKTKTEQEKIQVEKEKELQERIKKLNLTPAEISEIQKNISQKIGVGVYRWEVVEYFEKEKKDAIINDEKVSPVGKAIISSKFLSDRSKCDVCSNTHGGTDYAVPIGTPVKTKYRGIVVRSYYSGSLGHTVIILHGDSIIKGEKVYTLYGHGSERLVQVNDKVKSEDVIMLSGNTGRGTGPHLHYEVISSPYDVLENDFYFKDKLNHRYGPEEFIKIIKKYYDEN